MGAHARPQADRAGRWEGVASDLLRPRILEVEQDADLEQPGGRRVRLLPLLRTSGGRRLRGLLQSATLGHALPLLSPKILTSHIGPSIQGRFGGESSRHAVTCPPVWDCSQALNIFTLHNKNAFQCQDNTYCKISTETLSLAHITLKPITSSNKSVQKSNTTTSLSQ